MTTVRTMGIEVLCNYNIGLIDVSFCVDWTSRSVWVLIYCLFLDFYQYFPATWSVFVCFGAPLLVVIRPLNSILFFFFNFVCLLSCNCVRSMVKFVGFNRAAALFVGFCCEGLLAFFLSSSDCWLIAVHRNCGVQCCGLQIYNKVQIRVCLSKLFLVFFLPLTFWCTILV